MVCLKVSLSTYFPGPLPYVFCTGYSSVLRHMNGIIADLKTTPGAKRLLTLKYQQEQWIDITVHPTEDQLVTLALYRIQQDPNQYDVFIDMLRSIAGMELTVGRITSFSELYMC